MLSLLEPHELDLGPYKIDVGRKKSEVGNGGVADRLVGRLVGDQNVVHGRAEPTLLDPQTCRRIALGIQIHEKGTPASQRHSGRKVNRSRRLTDAPLLVDDCERLRDAVTDSFAWQPGTAHD